MVATTTSPGGAASPRWERRKESRPAELLDAALDVFVERGYAATRLDDVASRAGVSKGTLYLYFANKEELFKAVVRDTIVPLLERFRSDAESSGAPASELVERFFHAWWTRFGSTRLAGIAKLIIAEAGNFPEVARFFHDEVIHPNAGLLAGLIERGIARGEFRRVDVPAAVQVALAPLVMKAVSSQSIEPCCPADLRIDADRFLAAHVELTLAALRSPS